MKLLTAGLTFILNVHPTPELDSVFPFVHKEFHLTEHELPIWPIDVISKTSQKLKTSNSNSIRYVKSALIHIDTTNRPERVADDSPQSSSQTSAFMHLYLDYPNVSIARYLSTQTLRSVPVILTSQRGGLYSTSSPTMWDILWGTSRSPATYRLNTAQYASVTTPEMYDTMLSCYKSLLTRHLAGPRSKKLFFNLYSAVTPPTAMLTDCTDNRMLVGSRLTHLI
jgi:hypothetical protein